MVLKRKLLLSPFAGSHRASAIDYVYKRRQKTARTASRVASIDEGCFKMQRGCVHPAILPIGVCTEKPIRISVKSGQVNRRTQSLMNNGQG